MKTRADFPSNGLWATYLEGLREGQAERRFQERMAIENFRADNAWATQMGRQRHTEYQQSLDRMGSFDNYEAEID